MTRPTRGAGPLGLLLVILVLAVSGAMLLGYTAGTQNVNTTCRQAVEQITGPAEDYDNDQTSHLIRLCLGR